MPPVANANPLKERGSVLAAMSIFWVYPVLLIASLTVTWLIAYAVLGHSPRGMYDDPKRISDWLAPSYLLTWMLLICAPLAVIPGLVLTIWFARVCMNTWGGRISITVGYLLLWCGLYLYLDNDPCGMLNWFMD